MFEKLCFSGPAKQSFASRRPKAELGNELPKSLMTVLWAAQQKKAPGAWLQAPDAGSRV